MNGIRYPEKLERDIEVTTLVLNGICTLITIRDGANPKDERPIVKDACVGVCNYSRAMKTLKRFSGTGGRGEEAAMSDVWRGWFWFLELSISGYTLWRFCNPFRPSLSVYPQVNSTLGYGTICFVGIRCDDKRTSTLPKHCFQVPAPTPNDVRGRPTQIISLWKVSALMISTQ